MIKFIFSLLALSLFSNLSFAQAPTLSVWSCEGLLGKDKVVATLTSDLTDPSNPLYYSTLLLNNVPVPAIAVHCAVSTRPGTTYIRCVHGVGEDRIEFYPLVETSSGAIKLMQVIVWNGMKPHQSSLNSCQDITVKN